MIRCVVCVLVLTVASLSSHAQQSGSILAGWVQTGPGGVAIARVVTDDNICPMIVINNGPKRMQFRAGPIKNFPVMICEALLPFGTSSVFINGASLPLPKSDPQTIVAFGDTGCRVKPSKYTTQDCNDPSKWPAAQVSLTAAAERPDLVIHLGDILYREEQCDIPGFCGGTTFGSNWDTLNVDFFTPQAKLLRSAPWLFVRGDHELCSRDGAAWFLFFDPRPYPGPSGCADTTDPYAVPLGSIQLQIFDSSASDDQNPMQDVIATYQAQLRALSRITTGKAWFLTHKPIWGINPEASDLISLNLRNATGLNSPDFELTLPGAVTLLLTGHVHDFQRMAFSAGRPEEVIVGTGGTSLINPITMQVRHTRIDNQLVKTFQSFEQWGYLLLTATGNHWLATQKDQTGKPLASFSLN